MSQAGVKVWLNEEDYLHLKWLGIYMEWTQGHVAGPPKLWEVVLLDSVYQQLKMYGASGQPYGGMTLEKFLHTVNDTTTQDGQCTTTGTTSST